MPVMLCQTTEEGGSSKPLARALPIDPRHRRKEKRNLSELMFFRCTPEDKAMIENNAVKVGLEKSSYMRVQSTGKPIMRAYRRVRADWKELQRCMGVINKVGNVVNQLVKVLYLGGVRSNIADEALIELRKAARAVMAALGHED
ncbi:unnamed protein product [Sphagnum jensenii]|uniref:Bacterial mobilisation domain-containing protein n=1 Tax=Sphagnum jensenii TaxID=128206 RepID=A0ABP0VG25_9BRYO